MRRKCSPRARRKTARLVFSLGQVQYTTASFSLGMSDGFSSTSFGGILRAEGMISGYANTSSGWRTSNRSTSWFEANNEWSSAAVMLCCSIAFRSFMRLVRRKISRPSTATQQITTMTVSDIRFPPAFFPSRFAATTERFTTCCSRNNANGAEEGTRTPTPLRVHGPEPCASANSATSASECLAGRPRRLERKRLRHLFLQGTDRVSNLGSFNCADTHLGALQFDQERGKDV
jgi:hypothetical protein